MLAMLTAVSLPLYLQTAMPLVADDDRVGRVDQRFLYILTNTEVRDEANIVFVCFYRVYFPMFHICPYIFGSACRLENNRVLWRRRAVANTRFQKMFFAASAQKMIVGANIRGLCT